ncbi:MAG: hypothetical protein JWR58_251, partial [Pseudonocardia sp.]|nr:hypothetical protein [Pseudonocardia sp.]
MLRVTAVSAGAVDYLIRGSGCTEHDHGHDRSAGGERGAVAEHDGAGVSVGQGGGGGGRAVGDAAGYLGAAVRSGEAPGRWMGSGLAMVGVDRSRPAGEEAVRAVFGRLQHPETGESLGRAPRRFKTYQQRLKAAVEREA